MMRAFRQQILQRTQIEQFNAQQLSNLLWSLCIFQVGTGISVLEVSQFISSQPICSVQQQSG